MNIRDTLDQLVAKAFAAAGAEGTPAMVAPSQRPEFGDYQANGVMAAAKKLKINPRQMAQKVVEQLSTGGAADISRMADKIEIAGPGFINITLSPQWVASALGKFARDARLGVERPAKPQTVVVDYSAPNLAKEMHVGHLRSTIIGDALARVLAFQGNHVIRQNHVGDWGTQFGMLLAYVNDLEESNAKPDLSDLENFYRLAKKRFDEDPIFATHARERVVHLQRGNPETVNSWREFVEVSMQHCEQVYARLGVLLTRENLKPESSYNDDLHKVVEDLAAKGMLTESQSAQCVFIGEFKDRDGQPLPFIVQKSDEGFLYATTDLAAIRFRVGALGADRILYVVDARQGLHFKMLFAVARRAGFAPENVSLEHIAFGTMNGPDGKPFKTRTGGTLKLMDLLDEAARQALDLVTRKNADDVAKGWASPLSDEQKKSIAEAVGIGAVKYADLSQNRTSDYIFSWDKMLSLEGNTAPYMQYAYARICSIFRKGGMELHSLGEDALAALRDKIAIAAPAERALAVKLMQFPEAVATMAEQCLPNVLCAYLYELAGAFTGFYENCPVLKSEEPTRSARLALCEVTARTIRLSLELLGIAAIEQM